jgi:hypothetical protein
MTTAEHDRQMAERDWLRAGLYGRWLREVVGLAPDEAAALVIERYPKTRERLARIANGRAARSPQAD